MKILIADDHAMFRRGVMSVIEEEMTNVSFGEANNYEKVYSKIKEQFWDLIILDINMPEGNIIDAIQYIKSISPSTYILVLSMFSEDQYAIKLHRIGVSGFITKESMPKDLIVAIKKIITGRRYISPTLAEKLALSLDINTEKPLHEMLSEREFQVLLLFGSGKSASEIAKELALSVKTISTYRSRILEKMKMKNNAEIIYYAIKNNLVS